MIGERGMTSDDQPNSIALTESVQTECVLSEPRWADASLGRGGAEALAARCYANVAAACDDLKGVVALNFCSDADIQALNRDYRDKDKPTNVLSFPAAPMPQIPGEEIDVFHGDLALAYETCVGEADERGLALGDHVAHLIVHGMLHLLGYDHIEEDGATEMERLETHVLAQMNIGDPYAPESAAS